MLCITRNRLIVVTICLALSVVAYLRLSNQIVNLPVETCEILQVKHKLPINEVFNPPYEYTTNSGIMRHPHTDGYLVSFHTDIDPSKMYYRTKLHLLEMDKDFKTIKHSEIHQEAFYTFHPKHWTGLSAAQDPRLFQANHKIYMLYNDSVSSMRREVFIADITLDKSNMSAKSIVKLNYADGRHKDQKNWSPFIYNEQIYFIYTTSPFVILHWDPKTNTVTKASVDQKSFGDEWPLGDIRGGTPAIYVKELDAYLTFFHSCLRYRKKQPRTIKVHQPPSRIYYMGAYIFTAKPPFKLIAYTTKPLSFKGFYKNINVDYHIIFPCGLIEEGDKFLISTGIQDEKTEMLSVNKEDLYKQFKYIDRQD